MSNLTFKTRHARGLPPGELRPLVACAAAEQASSFFCKAPSALGKDGGGLLLPGEDSPALFPSSPFERDGAERLSLVLLEEDGEPGVGYGDDDKGRRWEEPDDEHDESMQLALELSQRTAEEEESRRRQARGASAEMHDERKGSGSRQQRSSRRQQVGGGWPMAGADSAGDHGKAADCWEGEVGGKGDGGGAANGDKAAAHMPIVEIQNQFFERGGRAREGDGPKGQGKKKAGQDDIASADDDVIQL